MTEVARIAMWSGPRTLSTALMRAFENRPDTVVIDEPLYAFYLDRTGISHPGRDEILRSMPLRWSDVISQLTSDPLPPGRTVFYQKHMTHHLLPEVDRSALGGLRHAFLIRDPRRLLASYAKVRDTPTLADLGLAQQVEIFRLFGGPVIDAADLAAAPREALGALCEALDIPFDPAMLAWPAGPRPTDGVWARYWYAGVWASTGFSREPGRGPMPEPGRGPMPEPGRGPTAEPGRGPTAAATPGFGTRADIGLGLPAELEPLAARCQPFYDELSVHRIGRRGAGP
jgi:Sulfotransferase domain